MELVFKKTIPSYVSKHFKILFGDRFELDHDNEFAYVLYDGDYPVGCVYGEVIDYIFDKHTGKIRPYIAIHKFEVRKNMRDKGVGRIMYNTLLETLNPYLITLYFLDDNALEFWKHMGFKRHRKSDQLYCKI